MPISDGDSARTVTVRRGLFVGRVAYCWNTPEPEILCRLLGAESRANRTVPGGSNDQYAVRYVIAGESICLLK